MRVLFTTTFLTIFLFLNHLISQTVTVGGGGSITCPATPTATWSGVPTGITFSNWARGGGVTCSSASNGLSGSGFNTASADASFTANKFYTVTITAAAGYSFQVSGVNWQSSVSSGSATFTIRYSVNGGAVTDFTAPINVPAGGNVILYLIASNTNASGTTVRWLNGSTITLSNVLPVEFSKFKVEYTDNASTLTFSTASETNNDYFTIKRSGDGRSFDAIGEIKGAGNSTEEKHYEFIDENPLPGINYYRIKQTDFDGQYSYSEIRSVRHTEKGNVAISPRSTDGRLDISTEMESYDVAVYSSAGQEVARFAALSGHQSLSIEALQAGVYFVKVMSGVESETVRVVKY